MYNPSSWCLRPPAQKRAAGNHTRSGRTGITLVEITVALTVLGVGILTLADATAAMQRRIVRDVWRMRAAELLASRVESLAATPCHALEGGTRALSGLHERWDVAHQPPLVHFRAGVDVTAIAPAFTMELQATRWCGGG